MNQIRFLEIPDLELSSSDLEKRIQLGLQIILSNLLPPEEVNKISNAECNRMLQYASHYQNYRCNNSKYDLRHDPLGSICWILCLPVNLQPLLYLLHLALQGVGSCCSVRERHLVDGQQHVVTAS
jgi:hypothetical protein